MKEHRESTKKQNVCQCGSTETKWQEPITASYGYYCDDCFDEILEADIEKEKEWEEDFFREREEILGIR